MARGNLDGLYAMSGGELFLIDPLTGAGSFVAQTNLKSVRGLAFGPGERYLYAVENDPPTQIVEDVLYAIDVSTGQTIRIGSMGYVGVQGLACDGQTMYAYDAGSGTGAGLLTVDLITGAATDVSAAHGGRALDVQCLFLDEQGELYGGYNKLYAIDKATGAQTLIGGSGFSDLRGVELKPHFGPRITVTNLAAGQTATLSFSEAPPFATGVAAYSRAGGGPMTHTTPWGTFEFDLSLPVTFLPNVKLDAFGEGSVSQAIPPLTFGMPIWMHGMVISNGQAQPTNSLSLTIQ